MSEHEYNFGHDDGLEKAATLCEDAGRTFLAHRIRALKKDPPHLKRGETPPDDRRKT